MNTQSATASHPPGTPIPLRIIFILNALMAVLPFIFYAVVTKTNADIDGLNPIWMIYTGIAYIASFAAMVYFILKRNFTGIRAVIVLNLLIALPAKAYIGVVVALISFTLTFNKQVKAYFLVD